MLFVDSCQFDDPLFCNDIQMAAGNTGSTLFSVYQAFQQMLVSLLSGMSGITVLLLLGPDLLVLVAISVIAQMLLAFAINKKRLSYNEEVAPITRRMNYFKEILFERRTSYDIKQYNRLADLLINKYSAAMDDFGDAQGKMVSAATKNSAKTSGLHILLTNIVPYSVLAYQVFHRLTTIADMTAIVASVQQACNMLNSMVSFIPEIKLATSYVEYFRHILDYEPEIEGRNSGLELGDVESVEFIDVSFCYPGVDEDALSCVNFKLNRGRKLRSLGSTAPGKRP